MTSKEKYRQLCKQEKSIPIFSQDWWLDTVCGEEKWDVAIVENNGQVIAALPYQYKKKYGISYIINPKLTPYLSLWINYPQNQKSIKKQSFEKKIINEITKKLPDFNWFNLGLHYNLTNWLPFYWNNFKQTTKYTYILQPKVTIDDTVKLFSDSTKNILKKEISKNEIQNKGSDETFFTLIKKTFKKQNLVPPIKLELLQKITAICKDKNCGEILFAKNNNHILSGLFFVCDTNYLYILMTGRDNNIPNNNSLYKLIYEAIKIAINKNINVDFEGSMIEPVEHFFRSFGGKQTPYFQIEKVNSPLLKTYFFLKDLF